ncbi:actin-binding protein wsp1-like [Miscanthus floridulus]|uniref:actin-binding protein wsp1-like n=1 Tax=Miscanthus floridulus TaxID=154761 RepID=UPI00345798D0
MAGEGGCLPLDLSLATTVPSASASASPGKRRLRAGPSAFAGVWVRLRAARVQPGSAQQRRINRARPWQHGGEALREPRDAEGGAVGEDVGASSSMGSAAMASAVLRVESPTASPSYMGTTPGGPRRRCPVEGRAGEGSSSSEVLQICPVQRRQRPGREGLCQERRPPVGCGGEAVAVEVEALLEETRGAAEAKRGQPARDVPVPYRRGPHRWPLGVQQARAGGRDGGHETHRRRRVLVFPLPFPPLPPLSRSPLQPPARPQRPLLPPPCPCRHSLGPGRPRRPAHTPRALSHGRFLPTCRAAHRQPVSRARATLPVPPRPRPQPPALPRPPAPRARALPPPAVVTRRPLPASVSRLRHLARTALPARPAHPPGVPRPPPPSCPLPLGR